MIILFSLFCLERQTEHSPRFIFLKNFFYQKECKYAMNIVFAQIRGALL